jgi:hypothetical protein
MACEEFGWTDKAISAYAEAAVQLSLIEDPTREAAAYTALARQQYHCGDIDSASRAASQAMFLYLHPARPASVASPRPLPLKAPGATSTSNGSGPTTGTAERNRRQPRPHRTPHPRPATNRSLNSGGI